MRFQNIPTHGLNAARYKLRIQKKVRIARYNLIIHRKNIVNLCRVYISQFWLYSQISDFSALCSIRKGSSLCPNPFKGFTLWSESFEGLKGVGEQTTVFWSAHLRHPPVPTRRRRHHRNQHKGSWGPEVTISCTLRILLSEGPFEVASFEHFGLERSFNMATIIVFTLKLPFRRRYVPFRTHRCSWLLKP